MTTFQKVDLFVFPNFYCTFISYRTIDLEIVDEISNFDVILRDFARSMGHDVLGRRHHINQKNGKVSKQSSEHDSDANKLRLELSWMINLPQKWHIQLSFSLAFQIAIFIFRTYCVIWRYFLLCLDSRLFSMFTWFCNKLQFVAPRKGLVSTLSSQLLHCDITFLQLNALVYGIYM